MAANKIEDISELKNLNLLEKLHIGHNRIKNIDSVMGMNELKELWCSYNPIKDDDKFKLLEERIKKNNPNDNDAFMWKRE